MELHNLTIILRTCDKVTTFSGTRPRDFGSKFDVMIKCIKSLKKSIDYFTNKGNTCTFLIVDDHSSNEMISFLKSLNATELIHLENSGNGQSFVKCIDLAKNQNGLVFLVEDDYLLREECLFSMVESYHKIKKDLGREICIHPIDYPDRYKQLYPSLITLGFDRHYRTIKHTTGTIMYQSFIFTEFEKQLKLMIDYGINPTINEDTSINLVYNKYLCFSPIPSLAEHYQFKNTLSPFFN